MIRARPVVLSTWILALAGCGGSYRAADPGPALPATTVVDLPVGRTGDVLSGLDIQGTHTPTAYDAIRRLRPQLLSRRGIPMPTDPDQGFAVVYMKRAYLGSLDELRAIPTSMVLEIRYLSTAAAWEWLGRHHPGGVIAITPRH